MTSLRLRARINERQMMRGNAASTLSCAYNRPVHDDGSFLDDAVGPNHDGTRDGKNGCLWMYDSSC